MQDEGDDTDSGNTRRRQVMRPALESEGLPRCNGMSATEVLIPSMFKVANLTVTWQVAHALEQRQEPAQEALAQ